MHMAEGQGQVIVMSHIFCSTVQFLQSNHMTFQEAKAEYSHSHCCDTELSCSWLGDKNIQFQKLITIK